MIEMIVKQVVPGSDEEWTPAGIDEFLGSYLNPVGRAAFYAAARNIHREEPRGPDGLSTRRGELEPDALFVWGREGQPRADRVRTARARAAAGRSSPRADCGHVPQLEQPRQTHEAMAQFLADETIAA